MLFAEVIGNLGKDAEVKTGKNGKNYVSFAVAHSWKNGEQEETVWINCMYHNEKVASNLTKGKRVYVNGDITVKVYNDKPDITMSVNKLQYC